MRGGHTSRFLSTRFKLDERGAKNIVPGELRRYIRRMTEQSNRRTCTEKNVGQGGFRRVGDSLVTMSAGHHDEENDQNHDSGDTRAMCYSGSLSQEGSGMATGTG